MALSKQQLMQLWVQAGGKRAAAGTAASIALAESGGRVNALNARAPDYSVGPWQINYYGNLGAPRTRQFGSAQLLRSDPLANARAAVRISSGGSNFSPWSTYQSGAYKKYTSGNDGVTAQSLRAMGAAPVGTPEFAQPGAYSRFAQSFINARQSDTPQSAQAMLGAILQLRGDMRKGSVASGPVPSSMSSVMSNTGGFNKDFASRLAQLEKATGVHVTSGYRSPEEQAKLFNAAVQKYGSVAAARIHVAPPGLSNHNKGLAADIAGNLDLAHKLAPRYGLTFPMSYEPWHIEPIGIR